MEKTMGEVGKLEEKIIELLVSLLEDQKGVKIEYIIKDKDKDKNT